MARQRPQLPSKPELPAQLPVTSHPVQGPVQPHMVTTPSFSELTQNLPLYLLTGPGLGGPWGQVAWSSRAQPPPLSQSPNRGNRLENEKPALPDRGGSHPAPPGTQRGGGPMSVPGTHDSGAQPKGSGSTGNSSGPGRSTCPARGLHDKAGAPRPLGGGALSRLHPHSPAGAVPGTHPSPPSPCPTPHPRPPQAWPPRPLSSGPLSPSPLAPKPRGQQSGTGHCPGTRQGEWRDTDPPSLHGDSGGTVDPWRPSPQEAQAARNAGGGRVPGPQDTPVLSPALPGRSGVRRDSTHQAKRPLPRVGGAAYSPTARL